MKLLTLLTCAVCVLIPMTSMAGLISNPVAYWNFDTNLAATVGGPTYDATAYNGATITTTTGKFGGSASFTKASSQYLQTAASPFTTGSYSYSAWYYLNVDDITGSNRYFVLEATNAAASVWPVSYGLKEVTGDVGNVFTHTSGSSTANFTFPESVHKTWQNVAVTYDAATGVTNGYLNGALKGSMTAAGTLMATTKLVIGGHRVGTGRNWEGYIDDVAVWDHVISQDEITALQTTPVPEPGTLALFACGLIGLIGYRTRRGLRRS